MDIECPTTRRTVLRGALTAVVLAITRPLLAQARRSSLRGRQAGEERQIHGMPVCWCPAGRFVMGSPPSEPDRRPGEDQVEVTLTRGFWMAKTERARESGAMPKHWEFRLPTEAQWEYACRAGTTTATSFGDALGSNQANFKGKSYNGAKQGPSLGRAAKVGSYPANAWGLHDMHGNSFEWCRDWYHSRLPGGADPDLYFARSTAVKNRTGDISRVRRGGCWADEGWPCRSAFRLRFEPERRYDHIGFRVAAVEL